MIYMAKKLTVKEQNAKDNYDLNQKRLASDEARWNTSGKTSNERNIVSASKKNEKN